MTKPPNRSIVRYIARGLHLRIHELLRPVLSRSGAVARFARYPIPFSEPWRRRELHLRRDRGLGDVLLCTPALRELKRKNPGCRVHLYTDFGEVVTGLPFIDELHKSEEAPEGFRRMHYEDATPSAVHLAKLMGDYLGLSVSDTTPSCAVDRELVSKYESKWGDLPRPHILILRRASAWTPNKNWPDDLWGALIRSLCEWSTVIEIGEDDGTRSSLAGSYVDLRGKTSTRELIAAVAAADLYVGPISGPMHIAAGVGTRAVVIAGGYEDPRGVAYRGQTYLFSPVECAPCWLQTPCPYGKRCLTVISPETVEQHVRLACGLPDIERAPQIVRMTI